MSAAGLPVKMVALEPAHALMVLCAELDPTTMVQLDVSASSWSSTPTSAALVLGGHR